MKHAEAPQRNKWVNWSWITYIFDILTPVVKDIFDKASLVHLPLAGEAMFAKHADSVSWSQ